jgi:hypothetical protein
VALAGALYWFTVSTKEGEGGPALGGTRAKSSNGSVYGSPPSQAQVPHDDHTGFASGSPADEFAPSPSQKDRLQTAQRADLLARLEEAARERETAKPEVQMQQPPNTAIALSDKTGDTSEWQARQAQVLGELIGECYDLANVDSPELQGNLGVSFQLLGEPEIGGLVDSVAFSEEYSTIKDANLRECVEQSLYALELDPPPSGTSVVRYLTLRLGED